MPRQTSFNSGELNPHLHGRTDRPEYAHGVRTLKNFFVSRDGPAVSRPGTLLVRQAEGTRLIPFVVSDDESYVLEFGFHYIRFHRNGKTLLNDGVTLADTPSTGTPLQLTTDYETFTELQFAQVGDELHIVHPEFPERIVRRTGSTWSIETDEYMTSKVSALWIDVEGPSVIPQQSSAPQLVDDGTLFFYDSNHPVREWKYAVSASLKNLDTGETYETTATRITTTFNGLAYGPSTAIPTGQAGFIVLYADRPVRISRYSLGIDTVVAGFEVIEYNYYRGRGDLLGFIGSSKGLDFIDNGSEPDYSLQPLLGTPPLRTDSAGILLEFSSVVGFFQERRVLGGSDTRPTRLIASATGNYDDFDSRFVSTPGMALELELATKYRERIRWLVGQRQLLIGTNSNIWALSGAEGEVLDYDSIYARPIDSVGAEPIQPLVVGNTVLYVRTKGRGVRALVPGQGGYDATDVSDHARHLFVGGEISGVNGEDQLPYFGHTRQIIDWCYAEDPWGLVWAVRDDGVLLSMTISKSGEVAWARHETDGYVLGVCSVPEGGEDGVYLAVKRDNGEEFQDWPIYIERMTNRVENDSAEDDACVDCGLRFKTAPQLTYTGLDHLEGKEVYAVAVGNVPYGPLTVVGGSITLPELPTENDIPDPDDVAEGNRVVMFIGLPYTCDLETLDYVPGSEGRMRQKTVTRVGFEVNRSRGLFLGQDFDHLVEWRQRNVSGSYGPTSDQTDTQSVAVSGTYDKFARGVLRQTLPLPCTVLAITREVDVGG